MTDYRFMTIEDHRLATRAEVADRTKEQLMLLPHVPGDDLQLLCEELDLHAIRHLKHGSGPHTYFLLATSGTTLFLAKYLRELVDDDMVTIYPGELNFDPAVKAELSDHKILTVCQIQAAKTAVQEASCIVLAPERNVLGWMKVITGEPRRAGCQLLAYDPNRALGKHDEAGSYVFDKSNIWKRWIS